MPGEFLRFAQSIDSIDRESFKEIAQAVRDYLITRQGAAVFEVFQDNSLVVGTSQGPEQALKSVVDFSPDQSPLLYPVKTRGGYGSLLAYSYDLNLPLWVTAKNPQHRLKATTSGVDRWSSGKNLPKYLPPPGSFDIKTSVLVPLKHRGRPFGVMAIEFPDPLECTAAAKRQMTVLARAIARVTWLVDTTAQLRTGTLEAFGDIEDRWASAGPAFRRPTLFLAYSSGADEDVVRVIKEVLEGNAKKVETVSWDEIERTGNITTHIMQAITTCQFGICYFSEVANGDGAPGYIDNANVLFEAGMLHGLGHDDEASPSRWIPIRESPELTGPPPFDIAAERMIEVSRKEGRLDTRRFKSELSKMLSAMLNPSE